MGKIEMKVIDIAYTIDEIVEKVKEDKNIIFTRDIWDINDFVYYNEEEQKLYMQINIDEKIYNIEFKPSEHTSKYPEWYIISVNRDKYKLSKILQKGKITNKVVNYKIDEQPSISDKSYMVRIDNVIKYIHKSKC